MNSIRFCVKRCLFFIVIYNELASCFAFFEYRQVKSANDLWSTHSIIDEKSTVNVALNDQHNERRLYKMEAVENKWKTRRIGRRKRQALLYKRVTLYSLDSNMSMSAEGQIVVKSSASRIDVNVDELSISVWSNVSELFLDSMPNPFPRRGNGDENMVQNFALSASSSASFDLRFVKEMMKWRSISQTLKLNSTTNSTTIKQLSDSDSLKNFGLSSSSTVTSGLNGQITGNVNTSLSLRDSNLDQSGTSIEIFNGKFVGFLAEIFKPTTDTIAISSAPQIRIVSSPLSSQLSTNDNNSSDNEERVLYIIASALDSIRLRLRLLASEIIMIHGSTRIDISASYRAVVIHQNGILVELFSPKSPFEIFIDEMNQMRINCPEEKATFLIPSAEKQSSTRLLINIQQFLRMEANRTNASSIHITTNESESNSDQIVEHISLAARAARIIFGGDSGSNGSAARQFMDIRANNSQMRLLTNFTQAYFAAKTQHIQIAGDRPKLLLQSGFVTISVSIGSDYLMTSPRTSMDEQFNLSRKLFDASELAQIGPNGYATVNASGDFINSTGHDEFLPSAITDIPRNELPQNFLVAPSDSENINNNNNNLLSQPIFTTSTPLTTDIDSIRNENDLNNNIQSVTVPPFTEFVTITEDSNLQSAASSNLKNSSNIEQVPTNSDNFATAIDSMGSSNGHFTMPLTLLPDVTPSTGSNLWDQLFPQEEFGSMDPENEESKVIDADNTDTSQSAAGDGAQQFTSVHMNTIDNNSGGNSGISKNFNLSPNSAFTGNSNDLNYITSTLPAIIFPPNSTKIFAPDSNNTNSIVTEASNTAINFSPTTNSRTRSHQNQSGQERDTFVIGHFDDLDADQEKEEQYATIETTQPPTLNVTGNYFPILATISHIQSPSTNSLAMHASAASDSHWNRPQKEISQRRQRDNSDAAIRDVYRRHFMAKQEEVGMEAYGETRVLTTTTGIEDIQQVRQTISSRSRTSAAASRAKTTATAATLLSEIENANPQVLELYLERGLQHAGFSPRMMWAELENSLNSLVAEYIQKNLDDTGETVAVADKYESRTPTKLHKIERHIKNINDENQTFSLRKKDSLYSQSDYEDGIDLLISQDANSIGNSSEWNKNLRLNNAPNSNFTESFENSSLFRSNVYLSPNLSVVLHELVKIPVNGWKESRNGSGLYRLRFSVFNDEQISAEDSKGNNNDEMISPETIAAQLNKLGREKLSERIHFKVMSEIRVKSVALGLSAILHSLIIIPAGIVIIGLSLAVMVWHIYSNTKKWRFGKSAKIGDMSADEKF